MDRLSRVRRTVIDHLIGKFLHSNPRAQGLISTYSTVVFDHFSIIDLPGPRTGIKTLASLFESLGFQISGNGYLSEKKNSFTWLSEPGSDSRDASEALPQIVIGDFKIEEFSPKVQAIINKHAERAPSVPDFQGLSGENLSKTLIEYLNHFPYGNATKEEILAVQAESDLMAWVLKNGRAVNHVGLAAHLMSNQPLSEFPGGHSVQGSPKLGIEQCSIKLDSNCFVEFVKRYPAVENPKKWGDYFSGFLPENANKIIETLYEPSELTY